MLKGDLNYQVCEESFVPCSAPFSLHLGTGMSCKMYAALSAVVVRMQNGMLSVYLLLIYCYEKILFGQHEYIVLFFFCFFIGCTFTCIFIFLISHNNVLCSLSCYCCNAVMKKMFYRYKSSLYCKNDSDVQNVCWLILLKKVRCRQSPRWQSGYVTGQQTACKHRRVKKCLD